MKPVRLQWLMRSFLSAPVDDRTSRTGDSSDATAEVNPKWRWWLAGLLLYVFALTVSSDWGDANFEFDPVVVLQRVVITFARIRVLLYLVAALCWLVACVLALREVIHLPPGDSSRPTGARLRIRRAFTAAITAIIIVSSLPMGFISLLAVNRYFILQPRSTGDCALVMEVSHGAASSRVELYTLPRNKLQLEETGRNWLVDDDPGYDPVHGDSVRLEWFGNVAHLVVVDDSAGQSETFDEYVACR